MKETLDWNGGGRALVAWRFGPLLSQLASFVSSRLSGDLSRRLASRHDPSLSSEAPRPLGGAHKRIGPRSSLFCTRCCAWHGRRGGLVRISGPRSTLRDVSAGAGRRQASGGWFATAGRFLLRGKARWNPKKPKANRFQRASSVEKNALTQPLAHRFMYRTVCDLL